MLLYLFPLLVISRSLEQLVIRFQQIIELPTCRFELIGVAGRDLLDRWLEEV